MASWRTHQELAYLPGKVEAVRVSVRRRSERRAALDQLTNFSARSLQRGASFLQKLQTLPSWYKSSGRVGEWSSWEYKSGEAG